MTDAEVEQARLKVLNTALKDIRAGKDINDVMETMSKSLTAKLMHPIYKKINGYQIEFDIEEHRRTYNKAFTNGRHGNRSDS